MDLAPSHYNQHMKNFDEPEDKNKDGDKKIDGSEAAGEGADDKIAGNNKNS